MKIKLNNYDWTEAFNYADFEKKDVKRVIAAEEGENDGGSWVLVAELKNGKFGYFAAWCDYTGWD